MNTRIARFAWFSLLVGVSVSTGCGDVGVNGENTADACADGIDNDGDGNVDCGDAECKVAFFDTLCKNSGGGGEGGNGTVTCQDELCNWDCEIDSCDGGGGQGGGGGEFGGPPPPCETGLADPYLPYPSGVHMGVSQGPGCNGHKGKLSEAFDFNVQGSTYESSHDMMAVAATSGNVVKVVEWVTGGCATCSGSSYNGGWGNCVVVQIDNSCVYERYCHLRHDGVLVNEGDHVCAGQPLGYIGSTGRSTGDHLHYQRETASGWSIKIDKFQEAAVQSGCTPCATASHQSGCYESVNSSSPGCAPPPPSPCQGLASGKYCGANPELKGYGGNANDLVTCQNGQIASTEFCSFGCEIKPSGQNDACKASGPCMPNCTNLCNGAPDGCGGTCNSSCPMGTICSGQSCVACGSNAQPCCGGQCNAPLQCNSGTCGVCSPNCVGKCNGAPDGCGGTCNSSCPMGTICSGQSCVACTPNCTGKCGNASDGCNGLCNASCPSGSVCSNQTCVTCNINPAPSLGIFTPTFTGNTNCTCSTNNPSCHTLYRGKVVAVSADKWHADLAFRKWDNATINAGTNYWVVVGASPTPSCTDLNAFVVRKAGTVASTTTELVINDVPIWPDQATFNSDASGTTKNIFLITDGQGSPNQRTWFQRDALVFTKTCP